MKEKRPYAGIACLDPDFYVYLELSLDHVGFDTAKADLFQFVKTPPSYVEFLRKYDPCLFVVRIPRAYEACVDNVNELMAVKESQNRGFLIIAASSDVKEDLIKRHEGMQIIYEPFGPDKLQKAIANLSSPPQVRQAPA